MSSYPNLPGVQVYTIDGGLASRIVPQDKLVLICGTAGSGPVGDTYQVTDPSKAALVYGLSGSLIKAMSEVSANCDNIVLYRIGTKPTFLNDVGKETGSTPTAGFNIQFGSADTNMESEYRLWYKNGVLYIWFQGDLVYANDVTNSVVVDTGDCSIVGAVSGNTGLQLGSGSTGGYSAAITLQAAAAIVGGTDTPAPTLVPGTDGLSMTVRDTYIALAKALELLTDFPVDMIYCPDAIVNAKNVAYKATANGDTSVLDWLKTSTDAYGNKTYQWASETLDDTGATVTAMSGSITTPAARLAASFHEVHFEYLISKFCYAQETVGGSGTCIGFVGTSGPNSFSLYDTRKWVGYLPTYSATNPVQALNAGTGLLGIPVIVGCPGTSVNSLCADSLSYRKAGLFLTVEGEYDGTIITDGNGYPVDLGAYIHVVADFAVLSNGYATNYATNIAGYVAGIASALDEKINLTNQSINGLQIWKPSFAQMDSLTWAGINMLRFKGNGILPALLHGFTVATNNSDYHNLLRQRIKGLVVDRVRKTADPYIGKGTTDGLQLQALQTALDKSMSTLQKRGYISRYNFSVSVTPAEQRIGHAEIRVNFYPADELVQLTATVGISQQ